MKKSVHTLAITIGVMASVMLSCKSNEEKQADAIESIKEANQDLDEVSHEEQSAANDVEWNIFKEETETKISGNEAIISNLREEMEKPGNKFDAVYKKNIEQLKQKNSDLRARIDNYDKTRSDWEAFKREFNHDMEEIGNSLKDLTVNNSK